VDDLFVRTEIKGEPVFRCTAGYGSAATATFIRKYRSLLAEDIAAARSLWDRLDRAGQNPTPQTVREKFPQLRLLCGPRSIGDYVAMDGSGRSLRPLMAAGEILQEHFPDYKSIARLGRARKA